MSSKLVNPFAHLPSINPMTLVNMFGVVNHDDFKLSDAPSLSGKKAAITGGQAGIGKEMTLQLLLCGVSKVFVLARRGERFSAATEEWIQDARLDAEDVKRRAIFIRCDLSDIKQVAEAAEQIVRQTARLDILINNAGVPFSPEYALSPQGVEAVFATNHVGHFALNILLLPLIEGTARAHGSARIVNTSSIAHLACQDIDLSLLMSTTRTKSPASFDAFWRYARSKLANILFTHELASILEKKGVWNVYVNSFFPGNIPTEAMDEWKRLFGSFLGMAVKKMFSIVGQTPEQAAATAIYLAASKDVETRNIKAKYFVPIAHEYPPSLAAMSGDSARNLWYWTDHIVSKNLGRDWQDRYQPAG